jgi:hypothetical protein
MASIMGVIVHQYVREGVQFGQTTQLTVCVVAREAVITTTLDVEGNQIETIRKIASVKYCNSSLENDETCSAVESIN